MLARNLKLAAFILLSVWPSRAMAIDSGQDPAKKKCTPPIQSSLPVPFYLQEKSNWCWAASAQMVMEYLGKSVKQCDQANDVIGRNDCCPGPDHQTPEGCNLPEWPFAERPFSTKYGFKAISSGDTFPNKFPKEGALPWAVIQSQLAPRDETNRCKSTPVAFSWKWLDPRTGEWDGTTGHMQVVIGYQIIDNVPILFVYNPLKPLHPISMSYAYYISGKNHHAHWRDYYDIRHE
jgi:peptidase C39-like protein